MAELSAHNIGLHSRPASTTSTQGMPRSTMAVLDILSILNETISY